MTRSKLTVLMAATALASVAAPAYAARVVVRVAPPLPLVEAVPVVPVAASGVWRFGYWSWSGGRYVWIPGVYVTPPRPGAAWVPGRWVAGRRGWVWVGGYWRCYPAPDSNEIAVADVNGDGYPDIIVPTGPPQSVVNGVQGNAPGVLLQNSGSPGTFAALQPLP